MSGTDSGQCHEGDSFWRKIQRFAFVAGRSVIGKALALYFCLRDPDTPAWAKAVILGALGYFILPVDAIPDFLPGIGFSDDLGVLVTVLATLAVHVKREHRERAREILDWKWARAGIAPEKPAKPVSPAEVLGVEQDAEPAVIRKAYLDLVKKYHPDKVQHLGIEFQTMAEEKLKTINAAYEHFRER